MIHGWGAVRTDFADWFARRAEPIPPLGHRPHLIGVTRDEVAANPGEIAAPLFVYVPPRLHLTPAERRLLRHAVAGHTDVELAEQLGVALPTVKSRWRSIYLRVARAAPELLAATIPPGRGGMARGPEKRRRVLAYLRRHPEELRG